MPSDSFLRQGRRRIFFVGADIDNAYVIHRSDFEAFQRKPFVGLGSQQPREVYVKEGKWEYQKQYDQSHKEPAHICERRHRSARRKQKRHPE